MASTWATLALCQWKKRQASGKSLPSRVPSQGRGCEQSTCEHGCPEKSGRLAPLAWVQCFFKHDYQDSPQWPLIAAVFGKLHSDADWPKSYQPVQPCVWECVYVCVPAHVCEHTSHMYLHLSKFPLEHFHPQSKISKWGEMLIFPGNFVNCSCALLINIS